MSKPLSKIERERLGKYIRRLADLIGLKDWVFKFPAEVPDLEGALASVEHTQGRKLAVLRFDPEFFAEPLAHQRATIVHELLHCFQEPIDTLIAGLSFDLGNLKMATFERGFESAMEHWTDAIAEVLAPFLPLPWWNEPPEKPRPDVWIYPRSYADQTT